MKNRLTWKKIVILGVLLVTPFALAQCGSNTGGDSVASHRVGPKGPTFPGQYYFEVTVTPHTVLIDGTVAVVVRVFDKNGLPAVGVPMNVVGPEEAGAGSTDSNGFATFILTVSGVEGGISPLTVSIEDLVLTVPVQIIALGQEVIKT